MSSTLLFALLAGVGIFLLVEAFGPRPVRVRLTDADQRPFVERAVETFFLPASRRLMSIGGRVDLDEQRATLALRLARAGYPPPFTTPEAVLGYRLLTAVMFAAAAGGFALLSGWGQVAVPLMLGMAVFGWTLPDKIIANAEAKRVEQLTLDAASTLDRLAIFVASGDALPAAVRSLAERRGGAWVAVFRQVAADYAVNGDFDAALSNVNEQNGRLAAIVRVTERLRAAYEMGGGGVAQALRRMARDARVRIKLVITERGYKNAVLMVVPAFFAIIATIIILIAPGAVRMLSMT